MKNRKLLGILTGIISAITMMTGMTTVASAEELDEAPYAIQEEIDNSAQQQAIEEATAARDMAYERFNYFQDMYINENMYDKAEEAKENIDQVKTDIEELQNSLVVMNERLAFLDYEIWDYDEICLHWNGSHAPELLDYLNEHDAEYNAYWNEREELRAKKAAAVKELAEKNDIYSDYQYNITQFEDTKAAMDMAWDEYLAAQCILDQVMAM